MTVWGRCIAFLTFTASVQDCAATLQERYHTILRTCLQPRPSSVCNPLGNAWFYKGGFCKKVDPHVCGGGKNLFTTLKECEKECKYGSKTQRLRCRKPPIFGSCARLLQTWRFETHSGYCKRLNFTICALGIPQIATEEACVTACHDETS
ncbi:hypothetical protein MTO96_038822 [Rhipicephalus appendiculatus]